MSDKVVKEKTVRVFGVDGPYELPLSFFRPRQPKYSQVVDRSHFKPTSEIKRDKVATSNEGSGNVGLYDTSKGKDDHPTVVEQLLRQGRLDKADVQVLAESERDKAEKTVKEQEQQEALEKVEKKNKARQKIVDEKLGINVEESD